MNIFDFILISVIAVCVGCVIAYIIKHKGNGCCNGCSGCQDCHSSCVKENRENN